MSLLHKQGLRPIPKIITIIHVWAGKQLPIAERLVTALAGSYVHQGGFNIQEGGGNSMQLPINALDASIYILVPRLSGRPTLTSLRRSSMQQSSSTPRSCHTRPSMRSKHW